MPRPKPRKLQYKLRKDGFYEEQQQRSTNFLDRCCTKRPLWKKTLGSPTGHAQNELNRRKKENFEETNFSKKVGLVFRNIERSVKE